MENMTTDQIEQTVRAAADSVTVIDEAIAKLANRAALSLELKGDLQRNVEHLKIVTSKQPIVDSGIELSNLISGIARGEARLAEGEWPADPDLSSRNA